MCYILIKHISTLNYKLLSLTCAYPVNTAGGRRWSSYVFLTGPHSESAVLATKESFADFKFMSLPFTLATEDNIILVSCRHLAFRYTDVKTNTDKFDIVISWDFLRRVYIPHNGFRS